MPKINVLQNHTDFMNRMWQASLESHDALPLSMPAIDQIRRKLILVSYRGEKMQLDAAAELSKTLNPGAEYDQLARAMARAVEGDIEAWYCIAEDDGAAWLGDTFHGPLMRWNGAVWWVKLKGLKLPDDLEICFHEAYRKPKSPKRNKPAPAPAGEAEQGQPYQGAGNNQSVHRGNVRPLD